MQFEDFALKSNARAFASRSKAKAKPQIHISARSSTKTILIGERTWADIEPLDYSSIDYPVSKQLSTLLCHGNLPREEDGALEFWRRKDYLQKLLCILDIGLMKSGRAISQKEEETRKYSSIVLILQEKFFTSELFKVIHQVRIYTWRSEFEQKTDSILSACESHGQRTQGS